MPELPDVEVYRETIAARIVGQPLLAVQLCNPFLLRTAVPPLQDMFGRTVLVVERLNKRIVVGLDGDYFLVLHLMVAGRLLWLAGPAKPPSRSTLASFDFPNGSLALTEAGTKRRASLHAVQGRAGLAEFDRGGLEVMTATFAAFAARMRGENHTLKRALTSPHLLSGIGNAYSDEILHRARLSPLALTQKMDDASMRELFAATRSVLAAWTVRLRTEAGADFPKKVTAFRPGMTVHGRHGLPCPDCGAKVQRIVYAENECNYCARCQTNEVVLADRALSRLLHKSYPRTLDD